MTVPERLAKIEGAVDRIGTTVDRIDLSLQGNGCPGIKTRLDRLEGARSRYGVLFDRLWKAGMSAALAWFAWVHC